MACATPHSTSCPPEKTKAKKPQQQKTNYQEHQTYHCVPSDQEAHQVEFILGVYKALSSEFGPEFWPVPHMAKIPEHLVTGLPMIPFNSSGVEKQ